MDPSQQPLSTPQFRQTKWFVGRSLCVVWLIDWAVEFAVWLVGQLEASTLVSSEDRRFGRGDEGLADG